MSPKPIPTTEQMVGRALVEIQTASDNYARDFLDRMLAGEDPSEWDYAAAIMAADIARELGEFLEAKK